MVRYLLAVWSCPTNGCRAWGEPSEPYEPGDPPGPAGPHRQRFLPSSGRSRSPAAEYELRAPQAMTFFVPEHRGHDAHLNALALLVQATKVAALHSTIGQTSLSPLHEFL